MKPFLKNPKEKRCKNLNTKETSDGKLACSCTVIQQQKGNAVKLGVSWAPMPSLGSRKFMECAAGEDQRSAPHKVMRTTEHGAYKHPTDNKHVPVR